MGEARREVLHSIYKDSILNTLQDMLDELGMYGDDRIITISGTHAWIFQVSKRLKGRKSIDRDILFDYDENRHSATTSEIRSAVNRCMLNIVNGSIDNEFLSDLYNSPAYCSLNIPFVLRPR